MAATGKYDAFCDWRVAGDSDLEKWASDPNCNQQKIVLENCIRVAVVLSPTKFLIRNFRLKKTEIVVSSSLRPRNEVSADAQENHPPFVDPFIRYTPRRWIASSADPKLELATRASPTFLKVCFKDGTRVSSRR